MTQKIAINGFGRIGRLSLRYLLQKENLEVVAINDLTDNATLAHLFKYDTVHGKYPGEISADDEHIHIDGRSIKALSERDPSKLPWAAMGIDAVLECTGIFRSAEKAGMHLQAGAKKVIISAPAQGSGVPTIVLGVNDEIISADTNIFSNASCTTNCLAPMVRTLHDLCGIERGFMTTIHAYTADQNIQDAPHSDLRRARAAAASIVPTTTGAASAVGLVIPELKGKLDGTAMRVPVPDGSITDFTALVQRPVTAEEINNAFLEASRNRLNGILEYNVDPIVSADILSNPHSCIFDSELTNVSGNLVKVVGWYDNEAGYSSRMADLTVRVLSA